jgi:hypothetical protein
MKITPYPGEETKRAQDPFREKVDLKKRGQRKKISVRGKHIYMKMIDDDN